MNEGHFTPDALRHYLDIQEHFETCNCPECEEAIRQLLNAGEIRAALQVEAALQGTLPVSGSGTTDGGQKPLPSVPGYEVLAVLGAGSMGVVYRARQVGLGRVVALKMVLHAGHAGADLRERFQAEAQAVARLQHPHIVQVFEVGEHAETPFFSMEYCPAGSLADQLDGTPWEPQKAAALVETVARAMHAAHQAKVIHRDLKPANVLLTADGQPKVSDFGLAKKLDEASRTQSGAIVGTPSYMAPEQAGGKGSSIGPATDVYALGAILYELLTGRPPFVAPTTLDTLVQVLNSDPVPPIRLQPRTPRDLETICLKCLQKEAPKRYAGAAELAEELRRWRAGEPIVARPAGRLERAVKWARRRPAVAGLLLLVAVVAVAGLGGILWAYGEAVQQRQAAQKAEGVSREEAARAREQEQEALRQAYFAQVGRADAQLMARDYLGAALVLDGLSGNQRGWEYDYLRGRAEGTPLTLRGHVRGVASVACSPDGRLLTSASEDGTVKVWDTTRGTEVLTLRGHTGPVTSVTYSPDGTRIASASEDGTVRVWDARSGKVAATLHGHKGKVYAVAYSPGGRQLLASGSEDRTIKVWDGRTGREITTLCGHTGTVFSVCCSPDGSLIASGSRDTTVRVWDVQSGRQVALLQGHNWPVYAVAFSPDGTHIVSGSDDRTVRVWNVRGGKPLFIGWHTSWVNSVCCSPDGTHIASAAHDRTVIVWNANGEGESARFLGHREGVNAVCCSPDGSCLASASEDRTVKWWRGSGEVPTLEAGTHWVYSVCYSPDGSRLAYPSRNCSVQVCDATSGVAIATLRGHGKDVTSVVYSPDGSRLATASEDHTVKVWDAKSGVELATLRGHTGEVNGVCFNRDGSRIFSASNDHTVKVWNTATGAEVLTFRGHTGAVCSVCCSPDGTRIASASADKTVKVWDAETGAERTVLARHTRRVYSACWNGDGSRIATASADNTVRLWDAETGVEVRPPLRGHTDVVRQVSYSPDGAYLASASYDSTVRVWDSRTGTGVVTLRGHTSRVYCVCYRPDGSRLASSSRDETVKIWGAERGAELATLRRPPPGSYDPWAEEFQRRAVQVPLGHSGELEAARQRGDTYAVAFHRRRLAEGDNLRLLAWARLAGGDTAACRQTLHQIQAGHRALVELARPRQAVAATALAGHHGLAWATGTVVTAALLRRETLRRGALLVRAAALVPDHDLEPAGLVTLARQLVETEPQGWQAHELLGAALYRNAKHADAVAELTEAVRLHGQGGSLWAHLFLALAHQSLGFTDESKRWQRTAPKAESWEEQVLEAQLLGELDRRRRNPKF